MDFIKIWWEINGEFEAWRQFLWIIILKDNSGFCTENRFRSLEGKQQNKLEVPVAI